MGRIEFEKVSDPLRIRRGDLIVFPSDKPKLFAPANTLAHRGLSAGFTNRAANERWMLTNEITLRSSKGAMFFVSATMSSQNLRSTITTLSNSVADFDPRTPQQDVAWLVPLHLEEDYANNPGKDTAKFISIQNRRVGNPPIDDFVVKTLSAMLKFQDLHAVGFPIDSTFMTPISDLAMEHKIDCMKGWAENDRRPILLTGATPKGASTLLLSHAIRMPPSAKLSGDAAVPADFISEIMSESTETGRMPSELGRDPTNRYCSIKAPAKFLKSCHRHGAVTLHPKSQAFAEAIMSSTMYNSFAYLAKEWEIRANYAAELRVQLAKEEKILRTRANDWKKMKNKMKCGPKLRKDAAKAAEETAK